MAEFARTIYNFNDRIKLNDVDTDPTKFVLVDGLSITDTLVVGTEDEKPTDPGIIDYGSKISKGEWVVPIKLCASSQENMASLVQTLKQAFNPDLLEADTTYGDTTKYGGYHPLDWTETVGSTERDFRAFVKSSEIPKVAFDSAGGLVKKSTLTLKVADPRKYLQAASTLSGAGTANNAGTYPTTVVITITATGTTSTSLQITNTTTSQSMYITTALTTGQVLVLDTYSHSAKRDGTESRNLVGNNSVWWSLNPGNNTLSISNDTNCTVAFSWYSAWPL